MLVVANSPLLDACLQMTLKGPQAWSWRLQRNWIPILTRRFQSSVPRVMADLDCQLDCLWNEHGPKFLGTLVRGFLNKIVWSWMTLPKSGPHPLGEAQVKGRGGRKSSFYLRALTLTGVFIYVAAAAAAIKSTFKSPSKSENHQLSKNASGFQYQTPSLMYWVGSFCLSVVRQPFLDYAHLINQFNKLPVSIYFVSVAFF